MRELTEQLRKFAPSTFDPNQPVASALDTGEARLLPVVDDVFLRSVARSEEHLTLPAESRLQVAAIS